MVRETLDRIKGLLGREKEFLDKPFPPREEEAAAETYLQEMEVTLREIKELGDEYFQELIRLSEDKAREKELLKELTFLQELHRQREENMALCREKINVAEQELDRVMTEKKANHSYQPAPVKRSSVFVDSHF